MSLRIAWLSANRFGYELLKEVVRLDDIEVKGILTLSGSQEPVMYDGIPASRWHRFGIPVHEIRNINEHADLIEGMGIDLLVVCGLRQILSRDLLEHKHYSVIGFHPSLLPDGRGPAPIINTLLEGRSRTGLTIFYIGEGIDDGDIIGQEEFSVDPNDHAGDLYRKIIRAGKSLVRRYLPLLAARSAPRIPQDPSRARLFPKRSLADNRIDLETDDADTIVRKIRAFSKPYKGAYIIRDQKKITLCKAEIGDWHER